MKSFLATLGFLTLIPIPRSIHENSGALSRGAWWFPVVGAVMGSLLAIADAVYGKIFPPAVQAVLSVATWIVLSRGLHMDGLADTADGMLSFRPRDKILEIMRDSRSGPMAVMAVVGVMAVKIAALHSLPAGWRWKTLLLAPVTGRCAMGLVMGLFPYSRADGGLASAFQSGHRLAKAAWFCLWILVPAIVAIWGFGLILGGLSLAVAWAFGAWVRGRIGGYTGDTLGATCEIAETTWLLLFLIIVPRLGGH